MRHAQAVTTFAVQAAAVLYATAVHAQMGGPVTWPQRGVKIVTPLPAGTGVDLTARLYADGLAKRWGQPVVVENRVGADGITAAASFVGARDDQEVAVAPGDWAWARCDAKTPFPGMPDPTQVCVKGGFDPAQVRARNLLGLCHNDRGEHSLAVEQFRAGLIDALTLPTMFGRTTHPTIVSEHIRADQADALRAFRGGLGAPDEEDAVDDLFKALQWERTGWPDRDRKSTRLNSSHRT